MRRSYQYSISTLVVLLISVAFVSHSSAGTFQGIHKVALTYGNTSSGVKKLPSKVLQQIMNSPFLVAKVRQPQGGLKLFDACFDGEALRSIDQWINGSTDDELAALIDDPSAEETFPISQIIEVYRLRDNLSNSVYWHSSQADDAQSGYRRYKYTIPSCYDLTI